MEPFSIGSPVPSLLWEAFQDALEGNMRRLAKDIAKTLLQPEAPLLAAIMTKTVRPYIFEETDDRELDMRCDYICQRPATPGVLQSCGQPVLWSSGISRCPEHVHSQQKGSTLPTVYPLDYEEPLYVTEDGTAYSAAEGFVARGRFDKERKRLTLFTVL